MSTAHPYVDGTVEIWHRGEGWGVLRTPAGLSVWCHFSSLVMGSYRELEVGEYVRFDFETPGQDGCDGRVLTSAQPVDHDSSVEPSEPSAQPDAPGAYASRLIITLDDQ